jgi:hypothetical protein
MDQEGKPTVKQRMTAADAPNTTREALLIFVKHPNVVAFGLAGLGTLIWHFYLGGWMWLDAVIAAFVIFSWPFMEWRLHIKILHMKPTTLFGKDFYPKAAAKHRQHHIEPWRMELIFLIPSVLMAIPIVFIVAYLLFPFPQALTVCFVGYLMTVQYEWTHFITHTRVQPKSNYYKKVFRNHRLHHFKNERYWYAFGGPWVDTYYGTGPDPDSVESSENCRTLGID